MTDFIDRQDTGKRIMLRIIQILSPVLGVAGMLYARSLYTLLIGLSIYVLVEGVIALFDIRDVKRQERFETASAKQRKAQVP